MTRTHSARTWIAGLAAAALVLAGCGGDDDSPTSTAAATTPSTAVASTASSTTASSSTAAAATDDTGTTPPAAGTAETTTGSGGDATPPATGTPATATNAVVVDTPGMSFSVSGSLRPGVATITLRNDDDVAHMLAMAPLQPGVTLDQVSDALADGGEDALSALLAVAPDEAVYGTPAPVGAGESTTVTAADLPAGTYLLVCFFAGADGVPHVAQGMFATLDVTGEPYTTVPDTAGVITLGDDGATLPSGFGHGTYEVTNEGTTAHSLSLARLDSGTTLDAYYAHVGAAMSGSAPVDGGGGILAGGVDGLLPGQSAYLTVDLPAGHYAYISTQDATGPTLPAIHGEFDVA